LTENARSVEVGRKAQEVVFWEIRLGLPVGPAGRSLFTGAVERLGPSARQTATPAANERDRGRARSSMTYAT